MIFGCEEIHKLRVEMADKYRTMPKEEAARDFKEKVEGELHAIEEIRRQKKEAVGQ